METTWQDIGHPLKFPKLNEHAKTEVVIIGGGLAGLLSAYLLAKEGREITVLEKATLGSDATVRTTAFITQVIDTQIADLKSMFGTRVTKEIWKSGGEAIRLLERIIRDERIDCEFKKVTARLYANSSTELQNLKKEEKAANRLGFRISLKTSAELGFYNCGILSVPNQAKFHPLKFLYGLAERLKGMGVRIYEHSEAARLSGYRPVYVELKNGKTVQAEASIISTYDPLGNPKPTRFKKGMYNSYVLEAKITKGKIKEGIYWDTANPYHYFRIDPRENFDRILLGGADHRSELKMEAEKNFRALEEHITRLAPGLNCRIVRKWVGPILEPSDGLPLIGEVRRNQFVAAAFSGNGMTYSAISARIFSDLLAGRKNSYAAIYDPRRIPTARQLWKKGRDYAREFFGGAVKNWGKSAIKNKGFVKKPHTAFI